MRPTAAAAESVVRELVAGRPMGRGPPISFFAIRVRARRIENKSYLRKFWSSSESILATRSSENVNSYKSNLICRNLVFYPILL